MNVLGWNYWNCSIIFQEDVNKAFQKLRQQVLEEGAYLKPWENTEESEEFERKGVPKTLRELLELYRTEWTYSIIDMERVVTETEPAIEQELGTVYLLAKEALITLYGTDKPTCEDIEDYTISSIEDIYGLNPDNIYRYIRGKWQGIYFVVYKDNEPYEYHFYGISGD